MIDMLWSYSPLWQTCCGAIHHYDRHAVELFTTMIDMLWSYSPLWYTCCGAIHHYDRHVVELFTTMIDMLWSYSPLWQTCCGAIHHYDRHVVELTYKLYPMGTPHGNLINHLCWQPEWPVLYHEPTQEVPSWVSKLAFYAKSPLNEALDEAGRSNSDRQTSWQQATHEKLA